MGGRIQKRRKELGRSQRSVATHVGVSRPQVSQWENDRQAPSGRNLVKLAQALETSPEWITTGGVPAADGGLDLGGGTFPVDPPPEGHWIRGFLEAHLTTARNSGADDPIQVAFEATEARVIERRAQGDLSDEGYAYWLAMRLGAVLAEGYAPEDPEPEDPAVPDSRSDAA